MATICGLPICLSGINISTQGLSVKRSHSYCVQSGATSRMAEPIVRKDCSSSCALPSISNDAISLSEVAATTAQLQSLENGAISKIGKRRHAVMKEMVELDRQRKLLKQQTIFNQERNAVFFQLQYLFGSQQSHSDPDITQALFNRVHFCLEDVSEPLYAGMAANAA